MKRVRLTSGLGFYGDNWRPVQAAIEHGDVQFVCSDHLAELTLAILQKDRQKNPSLGYARDLLPMLSQLWPSASQRGVKWVLNAGGLNPLAAAQALQQLFQTKGWRARIAVITGDDVLADLDALQQLGQTLGHLDSGASIDPIRDQLVFANVYLGAWPIARALDAGADIVLTGRVADAALFLGPLIHALGWAEDDWQRLAQGVTAGHLLECSGQGSGGNFGSAKVWQRVPDMAHIGFPIAEVNEDGTFTLTKAPGTGGRINFHTVRQQLLYEVHDPRAYLTPDVVLNMDQLQLTEIGPDAVLVSGAIGHPAPDQLKLVAGYRNGWMGHAVTGFCWPDAMEKAQAVAQAIAQRMFEEGLPHDELCVEYLGHNAFLGPLASEAEDANEVWLRMAIRTQEKAHADAFPRLFPWLALSGPPYMGGFHGMAPASQLLGLWPTRVDRSVIEPRVHMQWLDAA